MNFLALCQRTARECGIAGTGPSTVVNQTGELGRIVNWVSTAWDDIQSTHQDWQWLRTSTSFVTVDGQATYTLADIGIDSTFSMWLPRTFRNYATSVGTNSEILMSEIDWEAYRNTYLYGANRNTRTRPAEISITPDKGIALGPVPAAGYTVTGDYFVKPTSMTLDADEPAMPSQYHMAIVYHAMESYGMFEAAQEVVQRGQTEFAKIIRRVEHDRLPPMSNGGSLA